MVARKTHGQAEGRSSVNVRLWRDRPAPRSAALEECAAQLWLTRHVFTKPGGCMGSFPKVHSQRLSEATSVCMASEHGIAAPKGGVDVASENKLEAGHRGGARFPRTGEGRYGTISHWQ